MIDPSLLPILTALPTEFRQPSAVEPLTGGQSLVRLHRLNYSWGVAVLKGPLQAREYAFYQDVAPRLEALGIAVPNVMGWGVAEGKYWVLREDFPALLPHVRWVGDVAVMATLRRLHALSTTFPIPQPFIPQWQPLAAQYQSLVPAQTLDYLARLAERHHDLFASRCVIAGDANATNWGVRADGNVVLFDWDRVGYGVPAHDVAVTVPGLGWPTLFRQVAAAYLTADSHADDTTIDTLAHDIAIAKALVIVEYINTPAITEENRQITCMLLPSWIEMIWQMDEAYHV